MHIRLLALVTALLLAAGLGAHGSTRAGERPAEGVGPDCRGFGGLVHGVSTCVRIDLATGRIAPLARRVEGPGAGSLACDTTARVAGHRLALTCAASATARSAGAAGRRVDVSISIDGRPPIVADTHEGYWDFIHVWVRANKKTLDLTIDYGVLE